MRRVSNHSFVQAVRFETWSRGRVIARIECAGVSRRTVTQVACPRPCRQMGLISTWSLWTLVIYGYGMEPMDESCRVVEGRQNGVRKLLQLR